MGSRRPKWQSITGFTVVACLGAATLGFAQFTAFTDRQQAVLEGNWQSCREADGQYSERIYDGKLPGIGPFELHMGPYHEFALFRGVQEAHRDHAAEDNLLRPYNVDLQGLRATHMWEIVGLRLNVALAGGSRDECESWFVTLTRGTAGS